MYSSIAQANDAIIERIKAARPHWVAVRPAKEAVVELSSGVNCCTPARRLPGKR